MYTSIIRAVKAHQADISRRPGPNTRPTIYSVSGHCYDVRVHLPATSESVYKGACTRLLNRLRAMYPEAQSVSVSRACSAPCTHCREHE